MADWDWDSLIPHQFESQDERYFMEFCRAAFEGNIQHMNHLISAELVKDINQQSPRKKETALHYACRGGNLDTVQYLVEKGAGVNIKDMRGKNSVHAAASQGFLDILLYLIKNNGNIEVVDKYNRSPLHWAASNKHIHILKALLAAGASVYYDISGNWQPLHEAVKSGDVEIAKILIDKGSSVNAPEVSKSKVAPFAPLHIAAREGHLDCVKLLLDHGAVTNYANAGNQTPLHEAAHRGESDVLRLLLLHGANPHFVNKLDRTPLHEACNQGHLRCAIYLLDAGSDVNAQDYLNETPLCHLLRHGANKLTQDEVISFTDILLQYGAKPTIEGEKDETPLMVANVLRERCISEMLYKAMEMPRSLIQICKIRVRILLGCDYAKVNHLSLPAIVHRILLENTAYYSGW